MFIHFQGNFLTYKIPLIYSKNKVKVSNLDVINKWVEYCNSILYSIVAVVFLAICEEIASICRHDSAVCVASNQSAGCVLALDGPGAKRGLKRGLFSANISL